MRGERAREGGIKIVQSFMQIETPSSGKKSCFWNDEMDNLR